VVGGALDGLDPLGGGNVEIVQHAVQEALGIGAERRHLRDLRMRGQGLQPVNLHLQAVPDQAVFAEQRLQGFGLAAVAAVDGGNGGKAGKLHGWLYGCGWMAALRAPILPPAAVWRIRTSPAIVAWQKQ